MCAEVRGGFRKERTDAVEGPRAGRARVKNVRERRNGEKDKDARNKPP